MDSAEETFLDRLCGCTVPCSKEEDGCDGEGGGRGESCALSLRECHGVSQREVAPLLVGEAVGLLSGEADDEAAWSVTVFVRCNVGTAALFSLRVSSEKVAVAVLTAALGPLLSIGLLALGTTCASLATEARILALEDLLLLVSDPSSEKSAASSQSE